MIRWRFVLALLTCALISGCTKNDKESEALAKTTFKIGVLLPLTGDGASYGEKEKNGILLAVEQANKSGDFADLELRTVVEDTAGKGTTAVSALQKILAERDVVVGLGGAFSTPTLSMVPIAERRKFLMVSPSASSPELTGASEYFFRVWPSDTAEGQQIAEVAVEDLNLRTYAIFHVNNDYGLGLARVFKKTTEERGGEVLLVDAFAEGQTNFRTTLTRIKGLDPQGVFIPGYYKELVQLLRQATELGIETQFLSCATFHEPELLELAGAAANGVVFVEPAFIGDSDRPEVQRFVREYEAKFNTEAGTYAAHGYDAAGVVLAALRAGARTSDEIRAHLATLERYPGVTGTITFLPTGDCLKPMRVMTVKDGAFEPYRAE